MYIGGLRCLITSKGQWGTSVFNLTDSLILSKQIYDYWRLGGGGGGGGRGGRWIWKFADSVKADLWLLKVGGKCKFTDSVISRFRITEGWGKCKFIDVGENANSLMLSKQIYDCWSLGEMKTIPLLSLDAGWNRLGLCPFFLCQPLTWCDPVRLTWRNDPVTW